MQIQRTSTITGITRILDLDITDDQVSEYMNGALIQKAFPNLTADEREFILTGITAEEWDTMGEEE
jgi:hypothetical protein